jgi:hypothetical protein
MNERPLAPTFLLFQAGFAVIAAIAKILLKNSALQNGTKLPSNLDFLYEISIRF